MKIPYNRCMAWITGLFINCKDEKYDGKDNWAGVNARTVSSASN
jgi:hypothetical protein